MGRYFDSMDVVPVITRIVTNRTSPGGAYLSRESILQALLQDPSDRVLIQQCHRRYKREGGTESLQRIGRHRGENLVGEQGRSKMLGMDESLAFRYPLLYLDIFILAGVAALFCLLAIWVGTGRTHWFVRAGTLVLALLALLPVQAHQPALMFAFALPAIAIAAAWLKRRGIGPIAQATETGSRGRTFGLRDLLLAMSLIGLICLGVTVLIGRQQELDWRHVFIAAPSLWLLAMLCYLRAFARRGRIVIAIAIIFAIPTVALAGYPPMWLYYHGSNTQQRIMQLQNANLPVNCKLW